MASPPSRNHGPGACASPRRRAPFDHLDSHRNRQERLTRDFCQPAAVTRQLIILIILVRPMRACTIFSAHISRTTISTSQIVHRTETPWLVSAIKHYPVYPCTNWRPDTSGFPLNHSQRFYVRKVLPYLTPTSTSKVL